MVGVAFFLLASIRGIAEFFLKYHYSSLKDENLRKYFGSTIVTLAYSTLGLHVCFCIWKNLLYFDRRIAEGLKYQSKSAFASERGGLRFHIAVLLDTLDPSEIDTSFMFPLCLLFLIWLARLLLTFCHMWKLKAVWAISLLCSLAIFHYKKLAPNFLSIYFSVIPISLALLLSFAFKFKKTAFIEYQANVKEREVYLRILSLISLFVVFLNSLLGLEIVKSWLFKKVMEFTPVKALPLNLPEHISIFFLLLLLSGFGILVGEAKSLGKSILSFSTYNESEFKSLQSISQQYEEHISFFTDSSLEK